MLERIVKNMIYIFVGVNLVWAMVFNDFSCFKTTVGFKDRLTSITQWGYDFCIGAARELLRS